MALPSSVTSRPQENTYIGVTGIEVAVQTGFAIRTGFYLTNSGNTTVEMDVNPFNNFPDTFKWISGVDAPINIPAGSTRFIPFDFYGLKDISGPSATSGPAGAGNYTSYARFSFKSQYDNTQDETYYPGAPASGVIKLNITGYVTGYYGRADEFLPSHPSGFLVLTGQYSGDGTSYNELHWTHPSTGYYYEKIKIQRSTDQTQTWSDLTTLSFTPVSFTTDIGGFTANTYYYGTPTGLIGNDEYLDTSLGFSSDYYYRLRGEHYSPLGSNLINSSEWVYGYPVTNLRQDISNTDILTGLVSGSTTLSPTTNPNPLIKAPTGPKQALKTFLSDREYEVDIKSKFDAELVSRNITLQQFTNNFTGYHVIVPENYIIGSKDSTKPAIKTGDQILDYGSSEVDVLLILRKNSLIAGRGGDGGDGGYSDITDVDIGNRANRYRSFLRITDSANSTDGKNGTSAIQISDSNIQNFKIFAHSTAKIYGGGGGGGGGDTTWAATFLILNNTNDDGSATVDSDFLITAATNDKILVKTKNKSGQWSPSVTQLDRNSLMGVILGGIGGGGQGFLSYGGKNVYRNITIADGNGSLNNFGLGNDFDDTFKKGIGGNGGTFGEDGETAPTFSLSVVQTENSTQGKTGGSAGYAIDASSNTNYTTSNFRSNLFFVSQDIQPSQINGFVARWDAGTKSYNTGTTQATNGQTVTTWEAAEKASSVASYPYMEQLTSSYRPYFYSSTANTVEFFNGNPCLMFSGTTVSMVIKNIIGSSPLLYDNISGFDIFYNITPFDRTSGTQFNANGSHKVNDYVFCNWSSRGANDQYISYIYNKDGKIVETTGLNLNQITFTDFNISAEALQKPSSSFVYNVSAIKINSKRFNYDVYQYNNLLVSKVILDNTFNFIAEPIMGNYNTSNTSRCSFMISDLIVYNRKLNPQERESVSSYLYNKNKTFKTTTSAGITNINNKNRLSEKSNFAGFILLNS